MLFLAKHELVPKFDLSSAHTFFTAAAPVGQEMMDAVMERLNNPTLKFRQGQQYSIVLVVHIVI